MLIVLQIRRFIEEGRVDKYARYEVDDRTS